MRAAQSPASILLPARLAPNPHPEILVLRQGEEARAPTISSLGFLGFSHRERNNARHGPVVSNVSTMLAHAYPQFSLKLVQFPASCGVAASQRRICLIIQLNQRRSLSSIIPATVGKGLVG